MWTSSNNSSYSSSVSSSEPHLPYQHPQPPSTLSLGSQPRRTMPKSPRFYSSPMDEEASSTPVQRYGYEQREPSIMEKPKLLRRVSHALDDIKEDFSLQLSDPATTAKKIKRRSTLYLSDTLGPSPRPETADGPPRSRPMSIISFDAWSQPQRLTRRLSRRLSVFSLSGRGKPSSTQAGSISSPNLIGSSTQYGAGNSQTTFL